MLAVGQIQMLHGIIERKRCTVPNSGEANVVFIQKLELSVNISLMLPFSFTTGPLPLNLRLNLKAINVPVNTINILISAPVSMNVPPLVLVIK